MVYRQFLPQHFREKIRAEGKVCIACIGTDEELFEQKIDTVLTYENLSPEQVVFLLAGYRFDKAVKEWSEREGATVCQVIPDREKYGDKAPIMRLKHLVNTADLVAVFGNHKVCHFTRKLAREKGKILYSFKSTTTAPMV